MEHRPASPLGSPWSDQTSRVSRDTQSCLEPSESLVCKRNSGASVCVDVCADNTFQYVNVCESEMGVNAACVGESACERRRVCTRAD